MSDIQLPVDPLKNIGTDYSIHRRTINGILASYNSNYDILSEILQNSVDAVEDALHSEPDTQQSITVTVNLKDNQLSVLDTGVGMSPEECVSAFAPHVSFKDDERRRRYKTAYRGFKGVGLTFIAYGTNNIQLHSKTDKTTFSGKMSMACDWVRGKSGTQPEIVDDKMSPNLSNLSHGTYINVQLSSSTKPKRLSMLANDFKSWEVILRTRTALGQIRFGGESAKFVSNLTLVDQSGKIISNEIDSSFLYPHIVKRPKGQAVFRFKNLTDHYEKYPNQPPRPEDKRQDGIYFYWTPEDIVKSFVSEEKDVYSTVVLEHKMRLYCFLPYARTLFKDIDEITTGRRDRNYMRPGLIIGLNGQRLADYFDFKPTRYESLAQNIFIVVSLEGAEPDQGRKTLKDEDMEAAQRAANRALQYAAQQRDFLRPPNDNPSAEQIENERSHDDWKHNVIDHFRNNKLPTSKIPLKSVPLTEQDVVAAFNQICAAGFLPGVEIFATSSSHTYDGLIRFSISKKNDALLYNEEDGNLLGLSPYIIGDIDSKKPFETKYLTIEFKSSLDNLISDIESKTTVKDFRSIDILVCWSSVASSFRGYEIIEIGPDNIDERRYPGVTHILTRLEDESKIAVIQIKDVIDMMEARGV